jgi:tRNA nucleotidyltransferase/poly(A) polymerase
MAAIAEKKEMVNALSGERIANEMRKLLSTENPAYSVRLMKQAGLAARVFGREVEPQNLIRLQMLEAQADHMISVWARALLLLPQAGEADAKALSERWKLARHETAQLKLLATLPKFDVTAPKHVHTRLLRLHGAPAYLDWLLMQAVLIPGVDIAPWVQLAHAFRAPVFPITAKDLMALGMQEGKVLGERLATLEAQWEQSDYTLTREALLAQ